MTQPRQGPGGTALVTGAGSGIGRMFTRALLERSWSVALLGRRETALRETLDGIDHRNALVLPTDISDHASVEHAFAQTTATFGRLDLLFNNAGTFAGGGPLEDIDAGIWRDVVDVNLNGAFYCAQAAYRAMKAQSPQGGRIINNGSVSAQVPRPNSAAYTATKHAITGLTKAIALEGRRYGIACGQIDIGNAATPLARDLPKGMLQADGTVRPEPTMKVEDVVDALLYMACLPLEANVLSLTVMASSMPLVGRG